MKFVLLSYPINEQTPTYGNKNKVVISSDKSILDGDSVNESSISLPLHAGTHIDFPRHFYSEGQTLIDFPNSFWVCSSPAVIEIESQELLLKEEIVEKLEGIPRGIQPDIFIIKVKTNVKRNSSDFWEYNYGFHHELAPYIRNNFPGIKLIGINSLSLTSFQHRDEGRKAHLEFLNPKHPILIIEDMDLSEVNDSTHFNEIIISPLQVKHVDGVPVSILAKITNY